MATEVMSMGEVVTMYHGFSDRERLQVSSIFRVTNPVLGSWLDTLQNVRNICAHHGRLWNRTLAKIPQLPPMGTHRDWYLPIKFDTRRVFAALTICNYLLDAISPKTSTWPTRIMSLILRDHPRIPLGGMGFPPRWQEVPLWAEAARNVASLPPVPPPSA
jgi:abortive infection bacteriophage resistance protein